MVTKISNIWGDEHSITAHARLSLAKAYLKLGDDIEAERLFHMTSKVFETQYGQESEKNIEL